MKKSKVGRISLLTGTSLAVLAMALVAGSPAYAQQASAAEEAANTEKQDGTKTEEAVTPDGVAITPPITIKGSNQTAPSIGDKETGSGGKTVIDRSGFTSRAGGSGDANSFLRSMPNVQYRNDIDSDPGEDPDDAINLRPGLFSISGGRVYDNHFRLNGVGINVITGTVERTAVSPELTTDDGFPNSDLVYGLHPQTVYVPSSFVENVTIYDSDVSAEFGGFLGGVVDYEIISPPRDRYRASVDYEYQDDNFVRYHIATIDGKNTLGKDSPTFSTHKRSASVGGPISDKVAWLVAVSQQQADTTKQRVFELLNGKYDQKTENLFAHASMIFDTPAGEFKLEGSMTDYDQDWESHTFYGSKLNAQTESYALQLRHDVDLPNLTIGDFVMSDINLITRLFYNNSDVKNLTNGNEAYVYTMRKGAFTSTEFNDWCQNNPTVTTSFCRRGGLGDREQGQKDLGLRSVLTASVLGGDLKAGGEYLDVEARRARTEDFTYYTVVYTNVERGVAAFNCLDPNDPACSPEQFHRTKSIFAAYDNTVNVKSYNIFTEYKRDWDYFGIRGGLRLDREDYLRNTNIAPRFVATVRPTEDFFFSVGLNRYYSNDAVQFAVRDAQPRGQTYTRTNAGANVDNNWNMLASTGSYNYRDANLKTPYADELTFDVTWHEPYMGGVLRLRYLDRDGKDQIAKSYASTVTNNTLTNDGWTKYRSASASYERRWSDIPVKGLDAFHAIGSVTWSEQSKSNLNYFGNDGTLDYIWYNNRSYTYEIFQEVTGNLDIPVRMTLVLDSYWLDDRLRLSTATDVNLPYRGVIDTGRNQNVPPLGPHDIYEDYDFSTTLTTDLLAEFTLHKGAENTGVKLIMRVDNLFDDIGNPIATPDNPYIRGRSFWIGAKATF